MSVLFGRTDRSRSNPMFLSVASGRSDNPHILCVRPSSTQATHKSLFSVG